MTIKQLVEKYHANRAYYLTAKYNETLLRSDFLDPLFELLGWDIKNNLSKSTNEREVVLEESLKANVAEHSKKPDYTFRLFSERKFFLEAKKPSVAIEISNDAAKQIRRYGFTAKLKISILSNFEYLLVYDCSYKVEKDDLYTKALIKKYHYTEYESKFDEIRHLLGKDSVYTGNFDNEWKSIEEKISQFSVDNLFLDQINDWRVKLGNEIFKYKPDVSELLLNDYVQSYVNRIIFLRVCEDRDLETYQSLLQYASQQDFKALVDRFNQADKKYNSGLFEQFLSEQIIGNISSVFWTIIKQLYYPESPYSFAVFSSDILGSIYEIFLSQQLTIQGNGIELIKKPENVDRDIISTPTFIIKDILNQTVASYCASMADESISQVKIADIACGSGAFLLEVFQLLQDLIIDFLRVNDSGKLIQTNINTYKLPFAVKKELLLNCIFGVDKDYNAVEATKFGLLLKLLETEDESSVSQTKPILPELSDNIFYGNSLIGPEDIDDKVQIPAINPFDFGKRKFDIIVGNPPYMKSEDMKQFTPLELPVYKQKYGSAFKQFDKYFLFIERGLNLLKNDGMLGYIVPSKFTKVGAGRGLRKLLSQGGYVSNIISFGANQVFSAKTTYTSILILSKKQQNFFSYTEVKSLVEWKTRDYSTIIKDTINFRELSDELWFLIPPYLKGAYNSIVNASLTLQKVIGKDNINNGIQTSANDVFVIKPINDDGTYIYFSKNSKDYKIEKQVTRPYYETVRRKGEDKLNTYRVLKPNAVVIYPYRIVENKVNFIPINEFQRLYPYAFSYLSENKSRLEKRDIKPAPKNENEWYRYGRSQYLELGRIPEKIVIGVMSAGEKYPIDFSQTLHTAGGTAGYCSIFITPPNLYSLYYIQAVLNSKYTEWVIHLRGEVFRGGYIARGTKVLKNVPIPKIDFNIIADKSLHDSISLSQKELIEMQTQIDKNAGNKRVQAPLIAQFDRQKKELDEKLAQLYNLGNDDQLIPSIEELYELN